MAVNNVVLAGFAGDSLSLGTHWCYFNDQIEAKYGVVRDLIAPELVAYHAGKAAGDFTHYGDQTFWLLQSLEEKKSFDADTWKATWFNNMATYTGYKDSSSRNLLTSQQEGKAVEYTFGELAPICRFFPLLALYHSQEEELVRASKQQVALTHTNPYLATVVEFFARLVYAVLHRTHGDAPLSQIMAAIAASLGDQTLIQDVQRGLNSVELDAESAIRSYEAGEEKNIQGKTVVIFPGKGAFISRGPLSFVVYSIAKFSNNLEEALIANTNVGGDTGPRGALIAVVLAAAGQPVPERWLNFNKKQAVEHILSNL